MGHLMCHLSPHTLPPPDPVDGARRTYRGGGMNETFCDFFVKDLDFRFPGFEASSFDRSVARDVFMRNATAKGFAAVELIFEVEDGCMHCMFLEPKYSLVATESELLLAPYTWCTVLSVQWGVRGDPSVTNFNNPH